MLTWGVVVLVCFLNSASGCVKLHNDKFVYKSLEDCEQALSAGAGQFMVLEAIESLRRRSDGFKFRAKCGDAGMPV